MDYKTTAQAGRDDNRKARKVTTIMAVIAVIAGTIWITLAIGRVAFGWGLITISASDLDDIASIAVPIFAVVTVLGFLLYARNIYEDKEPEEQQPTVAEIIASESRRRMNMEPKRAAPYPKPPTPPRSVDDMTMQLPPVPEPGPDAFTAPMIDKESCASCYYFKQIRSGSTGFCRRNPPTMVEGVEEWWGFPVTRKEMWCGEYENRAWKQRRRNPYAASSGQFYITEEYTKEVGNAGPDRQA